MKAALATRYANLEWAVFDREANLDDYFGLAARRIASARDEGAAKAAFDGLIRRLGDGHVEIDWPSVSASQDSKTHDTCAEAGYDARKSGSPLAALAKGYAPLTTLSPPVFPAGIISIDHRKLGVLRIGMFGPQGTPHLCTDALAALSIAPDAPCDDACSDRIDNWAHARMTRAFIEEVKALKAAKIDALLVDVTGNGGGSEWAEAAARMLTGVKLKSERMDFVRGSQWTKEFADAEAKLRTWAKTASAKDRALLLRLAAAAEAKHRVAATACDSAAIWRRQQPTCSWLGEGFFASGMLASGDPAELAGKPWAATVFTPMEYPYADGVWRGPLVVLVDGETWSAAEEFAAVLQDNHAAVIMGAPTGGAGCGHTDGSQPVVLVNSAGKLQLPDCARIRADGTNEVRGVRPDVLIGWRRFDGPHLRASETLAALPQAIGAAERQANQ